MILLVSPYEVCLDFCLPKETSMGYRTSRTMVDLLFGRMAYRIRLFVVLLVEELIYFRFPTDPLLVRPLTIFLIPSNHIFLIN